MNEDTVIQTLYDFRNRDFIASFLFKHIDRWIEEIDEELVKALESEIDQEAAYIDGCTHFQTFFRSCFRC